MENAILILLVETDIGLGGLLRGPLLQAALLGVGKSGVVDGVVVVGEVGLVCGMLFVETNDAESSNA